MNTQDRSDRSFPVRDLDLSGKIYRSVPDLYDLYDLAHVSGWEPYVLHDLARVSSVGFVLYRSCIPTSYNFRFGSRLSAIYL